MNGSHYTTYFLEMTSPGELTPKPLPDPLTIVECEEPQYQFNRFLYQLIGADWQWGDLDAWTDDQWRELVQGEDHRTWVAYYRGSIAGYFELYRPDGANTEIRYFGLAPRGHRQGLWRTTAKPRHQVGVGLARHTAGMGAHVYV